MAILYIARNDIENTNHQPHKKDVWPKFIKVKWQKPKYSEKCGINEVKDWNGIKDILKAMRQKYKSEADHDQFDYFFDEAAKIYGSYLNLARL